MVEEMRFFFRCEVPAVQVSTVGESTQILIFFRNDVERRVLRQFMGFEPKDEELKLCSWYYYVYQQTRYTGFNCGALLSGEGKVWKTLTERVRRQKRENSRDCNKAISWKFQRIRETFVLGRGRSRRRWAEQRGRERCIYGDVMVGDKRMNTAICEKSVYIG